MEVGIHVKYWQFPDQHHIAEEDGRINEEIMIYGVWVRKKESCSGRHG